MNELDITKIRGQWQKLDDEGFMSGGDDTVESIKMVAEKVNEIVEYINSIRDQLI